MPILHDLYQDPYMQAPHQRGRGRDQRRHQRDNGELDSSEEENLEEDFELPFWQRIILVHILLYTLVHFLKKMGKEKYSHYN